MVLISFFSINITGTVSRSWSYKTVRESKFWKLKLLYIVIQVPRWIRFMKKSKICCDSATLNFAFSLLHTDWPLFLSQFSRLSYCIYTSDWLLFLCPGKRELPGDHLDILEPPPSGSLAEIFRGTLRQALIRLIINACFSILSVSVFC